MNIEIKILNKEFYIRNKLSSIFFDVPQYQSFGAAAVDLCCTEDVIIAPDEKKLINTGIAIWIGSSGVNEYGINTNTNVAGLVLPRSGLGTKGLVLANTIGLIDEDYQGELKIAALNRGNYRIRLDAGDRIAQLMFVPVVKASFTVVDEFTDVTSRNSSGFGSTGV